MNTVANKIVAINPTIYQSDLYLRNAINGKICFRSTQSAARHFYITHGYDKRQVRRAMALLNSTQIHIRNNIWATLTNIFDDVGRTLPSALTAWTSQIHWLSSPIGSARDE